MDTFTRQQGIQHNTPLPVYKWSSIAHGVVHYNSRPAPAGHSAPLQPRYVGSLYASICFMGVYHQWYNHFFRLHTGDVVCRNGPCATCSMKLYDPRMGSRQQYLQPVADSGVQVINYALPQYQGPSMQPHHRQPASEQKIFPYFSSAREESNIVQPKLESTTPSLVLTSAYVKRESSSEGDATLIGQPSAQTNLATLGTNAIGRPTLVSWPTRAIKDEKMLRIQTWRTQVQPMPSDALQPDVKLTEDLGAQKLCKKRKASEDASLCDSVKRIKVESDDSVNGLGDLRTNDLSPRLARNSTPCGNCRVARKKCTGKRATCAFASPKTRAKAQWKQRHISAKDET